MALAELEAMISRNVQVNDERCQLVPLPDRLKGPAHVAKKLMDAADKTWNEEQIELCALMIIQLERAWRAHYPSGAQPMAAGATLNNSPAQYKLPNDLGLPRIGAVGGDGCGKSTVMLDIVSPTCEIYFERVVRTASSNRAARGFNAKTLHSVSGLRPHDSLRTANLRIPTHAMR